MKPVSARDLVYALFELSYPERTRIFANLKLVDNSDHGATDSELVGRAIRRARERDQLDQLEKAVGLR